MASNATLGEKLGSVVVKWIVCDVAPTNRDDFSRAQEGWTVLRGEDGFVCQVGGWDEKSPDTAGVLAVGRTPRPTNGSCAITSAGHGLHCDQYGNRTKQSRAAE